MKLLLIWDKDRVREPKDAPGVPPYFFLVKPNASCSPSISSMGLSLVTFGIIEAAAIEALRLSPFTILSCLVGLLF